MDKKYQIFISSTYEDLKNERDQVSKSILEMGHIPVGMEMFSAADEEQWKTIKKQIEESDYYVVIIAQKYGSVMENGISYTEREYDYAIEKGVPVLGFIINEKAPWPIEHGEKDARKRKNLIKLKEKVKTRIVNFWSNQSELTSKVSISLMKTISNTPRTGWIKSNEIPVPQVMNELSRLSAENAKLRDELGRLKEASIEKADQAREAFLVLYKNKVHIKVRETGKWEDARTFEKTLLEVFVYIAPYLIDEVSILSMANNIALSLIGNKYYTPYPVGKNIVSELVADLSALDLVVPSKRKHAVKDKESYWSLTPLGKTVLKQIRKIRLEEGIASSNIEESGEIIQDIGIKD